jgi:hypothetical protein
VTGSTPTASAAGDIWIDTVGTTGYTQSFDGNGWARLPNGLIIQWGSATIAGNGSTSVTSPTSFTTVSRVVIGGAAQSGNAQDNNPAVTSSSTSGFSVWSAVDGTLFGCQWIAVGY